MYLLDTNVVSELRKAHPLGMQTKTWFAGLSVFPPPTCSCPSSKSWNWDFARTGVRIVNPWVA